MTTQVFIQSLADYNAGRIVGDWVDVTGMEESDLREAINKVLAQSKEETAEEWMIADYEGFYSFELGEYSSNKTIIEAAKAINEHGEAYTLYASYIGLEYATTEGFEEAYCGEWDSFREYSDQLFDELYAHDIPDSIRFYIDYEAFARDLEIGDYYHDTDDTGKTHVFRCI